MKTKPKLLSGKKVLLMEDDEVYQMLLRLMIEDQGAELILETDKDKAFQKLCEEKYDLLLLDTRLERASAVEFAKKLRTEALLDIPIIGMSSTDMQGRGLHNGLSEVLLRPIEYSNFIAALQRLLH